ncbi:TPA: hypothetical protein ACGO8N_001183 [Streptococcus suis]
MAKNKQKHIDLKVTSTGFKYRLDPDRLDNYELIETLAEVDKNPLLMPKLITLLLGKKQSDALKEHVRNKQGVVPMSKLQAEIQNIFENQQVKN